MKRKKLPVALTAVISALAVLLCGTFAWQSTSQRARNEAADIVNPGGRLHDDFDGQNKDIYVENFADEPIFARIRLSEYMAVIHNKGISEVEHETVIIGGTGENGERVYETHVFGAHNTSDDYWTWRTGGDTVYMPTFNRNKDSLAADTNGTYLGPDGIVTDLIDDDRYTDYVSYSVGDELSGMEIYDADANDIDEVGTNFDDLNRFVSDGNVVLKEANHMAEETLSAELISMSAWLKLTENGYDPNLYGNYWVYDTDGWVYWSAPILPGTATGLLLDGIKLSSVMDDSWYYAIEVTAQFVTADDIGKNDDSGFYDIDEGTAPTVNAETLLERITGEN